MRRGKRNRIALIAALGGAAVGCESTPAAPDRPTAASVSPVVLIGAVASLEQLAFETLEGLAVGDEARLERIRLTEYEHNELVWPELPASAPEVNHPVDLAWANIELRNHRARRRLLIRYGGRRLSLLGIDCRLPDEVFPSFRVLKDCWISFSSDHEEMEPVQFFKYAIDWNGQFKIFRYYDD
jgi:hypothetical protein